MSEEATVHLRPHVFGLVERRQACNMEREDVVRCVSLTATMSDCKDVSKVLFPSNPLGLQTPMDQVGKVEGSLGPGVLASPMRHPNPNPTRRKIQKRIKTLLAQNLWLALGLALDPELPHLHSYRPFFAKMASNRCIWLSKSVSI